MQSIFSKPFLIMLLLGVWSCQNNIAEAPKSAEAPKEMDYKGTWESVAAENLGNGTFGIREFLLKEEAWEVKFKLYLDSLLTTPVFQFRGVGKYTVQEASKVVEGADNVIFGFDHKYLTLLTDNQDLVNNFGFAACGLEKELEKEITAEGCSFLVSKAVCAQEFDLLKLIDGQLYLGMRPAEGDMCVAERRPTALFYPLKRK